MLKFHRNLSHMMNYFRYVHSVRLSYIDKSTNHNLSDKELLKLAHNIEIYLM